MPYYRKRPVVVEAIRMTEASTVKTLEGEIKGNPGDWLITGVTGEQYPCSPDCFAKSYEHIGGNRYRKLPVTVEAIPLTHKTRIETDAGTLVGHPGDWLVSGVSGSQYPCDAKIFHATYEPVPTSPPESHSSS